MKEGNACDNGDLGKQQHNLNHVKGIKNQDGSTANSQNDVDSNFKGKCHLRMEEPTQM